MIVEPNTLAQVSASDRIQAIGSGPDAGRKSMRYHPEIDGLRAIAVMSVLLYHADVAPISGGFVGVDIFFVISGYLIMATLSADIRAERFSVLAFYDRRIRRIFPALFVVAIVCAAAAAVIFTPLEFAGFGKSLIAMAWFFSNFFFCFDNGSTGYFATESTTRLLLHTWSLAVEEQFYIVLPIGLVLLRGYRLRVTVAWLLVLSAMSFAFSVWAVVAWPLQAFYLVPARAWELLVGSLLALDIVSLPRQRMFREVFAFAGLGLIVFAVFAFSQQTPFPGAAALLPCIGAGLIIHASSDGQTYVGRLLSRRPLIWTSLISYSLYLWHWPIIVLIKHLNMGKLNAKLTVLILLSSFAAGSLSYWFIERPFRGRNTLLTRRQLIAGSVAASLITAFAGMGIVASGGVPQRFDQTTRNLIATNVARESDNAKDDCENWKIPVHALSDIRFCRIGKDESRNILFWGDSHVDGLRPLVKTLYTEGALSGRGAIFAVSAGCPPTLRMNQSLPGYHCGAFADLALQRASADDIDMVFIAFSAWWYSVDGGLCKAEADRCLRVLSRGEERDLFVEDIRAYVGDLRRQGKRVVLSLPAPSYDLSIPQLQIIELTLGRGYRALRAAGLVRELKRNDYLSLREQIETIAAETGATIYDPRASLCANNVCLYQRNLVALYMDDNHIALSEVGVFHDALKASLH